jgi:two-component system CheB/CheR fusion protein
MLPADHGLEPTDAPDAASGSANDDLTPRAIFVIEDDDELRELLEVILAEEGHVTQSAPDGPAALDMLTRGVFQPELILADYNLPGGMNGLLAGTKIRERLHRPVPIVILTGDISTDTLKRIASEDCVQLNKPVKAIDLMQVVRRLLRTTDPILPRLRHRAEPEVQAAVSPVIFVVDDDCHVRDGLRSLLEAEGRVVETFATCEAFIEAYRPDRGGCLLIDANLPGMSGVELLQWLRQRKSGIPSIMITGASDISMAVNAMKAGASDVIEKPVDRAELLANIERALDQSRDATKLAAWRNSATDHVASLTTRQRQIMDLVLAGHPSKNIAADLGLSQRTVENHRAAIMKKTGTRSLPALARLALAAVPSEAAEA